MTWGNLARSIEPQKYEKRGFRRLPVDPIIQKVMDEIEEIRNHKDSIQLPEFFRKMEKKHNKKYRALYDGILKSLSSGKWPRWNPELIKDMEVYRDYMKRKITYFEIAKWYGVSLDVIKALAYKGAISSKMEDIIVMNYRKKGSVFNLLKEREYP